MTNPVDFFNSFDRQKFIGYSYFQIPSALDFEIEQAIRWFMSQPSDAKERLCGALGEEQGHVLMSFGNRMATLVVRVSEAAYVELALVALSLVKISEIRYLLMTLSLPYHSALKLGEDPDQCFIKAAQSTAAAGSELLLSYASRDANGKDIGVMGYEESSNAYGFSYEGVFGSKSNVRSGYGCIIGRNDDITRRMQCSSRQ